MAGEDGGSSANRLRVIHLHCRIDDGSGQACALGAALLVQAPGAGLAALLLPAKQDRRLIGLAGGTAATCLALLLPLLLAAQGLLAPLPLQLAAGQQVAGGLPFQRPLRGLGAVVAP